MASFSELWSLFNYLIIQGFGLVLAGIAALVFLFIRSGLSKNRGPGRGTSAVRRHGGLATHVREVKAKRAPLGGAALTRSPSGGREGPARRTAPKTMAKGPATTAAVDSQAAPC
jgi:hypothetical protein